MNIPSLPSENISLANYVSNEKQIYSHFYNKTFNSISDGGVKSRPNIDWFQKPLQITPQGDLMCLYQHT